MSVAARFPAAVGTIVSTTMPAAVIGERIARSLPGPGRPVLP